jgi:Carboxypeptidase regulatory-like domain
MVIAAFSCLTTANAQQTLGSINGTVLDPSGAAVSGSTITVTDAEINFTRTVKAQSNGFFQIFNLPVGTYKIQATHDGFDTTEIAGISVKEAGATTLNVTLKVGQATTSVEVTANPMLNATDATNGYTLDQEQIALTPLGTGSFTQLAILSPGVNAELLSGLDTNAGLGNQPIWANGQRDTSNTFQVNGVDSTNLFNGKSSSSATSQRYNFNIGTSGNAIAGASQTGNSVYGSNGNSLPSPPPEFLQELRVNTSLYDAQQGATSGAQIDANTLSGTNTLHGQVYGSLANNYANAAPFFFKQQYLLSQEGVGAFPKSLVNPQLHRWTTGATVGGPVIKDKLFFFLGYQHLYASDEASGLSQFNVPTGLSDDRTMDATGLPAAAASWGGAAYTGTYSQQAVDLLQAKLPNGQYLIPSSQTAPGTPYAYSVPNVTLKGVSVLVGDQATAALDYDLTRTDRLSFKYYYQNDPDTRPFSYSQLPGFPGTQSNTSQVGVIDNTISIGSRLNWEQRLGYVRMGSYSYYNQDVTDTANPSAGSNFGIGSGTTAGYLSPGLLPGLSLGEFGAKATVGVPTLYAGPESAFVDMGYHQNRLNPSTNVIFVLGKHTFVAGGGYSYTQLNIDNNRTGHAEVAAQTFETFLAGTVYTSGSKTNVLDSIDPTTRKNNADRYYRSNELDGYIQDKWQASPNLSITAGVRYDYHGGLTEKYGNIFNFDPSAYDVTGTDTTGFKVNNSGFVVAGNNKQYPTAGESDSTLNGRQWGISPRVGFAWSPKRDNNKVVFSGGAGIYFDRGELFTYLSQPAGTGIGGPFGVTESAPLASYVTASGKKNTFADPFGSALPLTASSSPPLPNANPATMANALQAQLNAMTATNSINGYNCGGAGQEDGDSCPAPLNFGAYNKNNVLPYTINFTFNMQWQPRNDLAITIGYAGNRGRHSVVPIPINEAQIATPTNPAMILGAHPHSSGETGSYGFEVLNTNAFVPGYYGSDYAPITTEPWSTYDGGNTDFRAPYVGYNPNATLFSSVGTSAYDALETHLEKRLSHHIEGGISYTWSHALDEQSDIGLFFTGNNPNNLRQSYSSADFDRTHVISANFQFLLPNYARVHSLLSYVTNDWSLTGIAVVQSGEPFSLYEFYGAVGSAYVGNYPSLMNPVLGIQNPSNPKSALTGNKGAFRGVGGSYIPSIDPGQIAINYLAPGQKGVPTLAQDPNQSDPVDIYETDFATGNQRNIFRQAYQKRADISLRKTFKVTDRLGIQYSFNVFNLFNTTSLDVPQNSAAIRQTSYACSSAELNNPTSDCAEGDLYGQVGTSNSTVDQQSALAHLDQKPIYNGSGRSITVPTTIPIGTGPCTKTGAISTATGCPNNDANFGSVTGTIGGARAITMGLHITY